jgi:diguanylate cyclase (GGDEF)-like protein/putative nucleotidyltransferase with HDIG domain
MVEQARLAEARGQRDTARDLYERALHSLDPRASGELVASLLLGIGRTHFDAENYGAALECIDSVLALSPDRGTDSTIAAALELRGRVRWAQGSLAEAQDDFLASRQRALQGGAASLAASGSANLAALAVIRGEFSSAVLLYETSLAEYRLQGDDAIIALVLGQLAPLYADLQRWNAAEQAFAESLQLATAHGDKRALLRLELARAEMAIGRLNYERAQASCTRALELAKRLGDEAGCYAHALTLSGVVARELGDLARAERVLEQAERMALDADDLLVAAETAREKADLFGRQDRHQQTLLSLNKAYRLLSQMRGRRTVLHIARRLHRLEEGFIDVVRRWAQRIESKDHATVGHCDRVAEWTAALAQRMGIDGATLFWYRVGALLHDIGKLAIPGGVLNKAGRLTADEWALVKRHPSLGAEMLSDVDFPWEVRPIVESHHECWDGSGYPHGLAGSQIPLAARIFAVADVFDALVTRRSFKQALIPDEAVDVMRKDVGRQFDPAVFRVFEELVRERGSAATATTAVAREPAQDIDDSLTAVPDRRSFFAHARQALAERRGTLRPVAILAVDVDHFRLINDAYGRLQGDDLLWALAKVLQRGVRAGDLVGRRGDDEFLVLLPDASPAMALEVAERLRAAAEAMRCTRRDAPEDAIALTISIGVANAPADGDTVEAMAAGAERALFCAKRDGRNAVVAANRDVAAVAGARLALDHFVGREEELRELVTLLDASARGEPQFVTVVGEAGIGKSSLLRQLDPEVRLRAGSVVVGRCADAEIKTPLAPWLSIVELLHERGSVPAREWPALSHLVPALRVPGVSLPPTATPAQVQDELVRYVRLATRTHPLVVVLEDAHWADSASWDVLEALAGMLEHERLLVCLTMRAEEARAVADRRKRLAQRRPVRLISLQRLTVDDLRRWVQVAFHDGALGDEFPAFVYSYTEGIPLYVIHVLRALYEEGGIWYGGTRWEWRALNELSLPSAIGEVLERRLDRLSSGARHVLASAAVLGPSFDMDLLLAAAAASDTQVQAAIDEGIGAAVLEATDGSHVGRYAFTHALLADACRRAIPERQRQRVHNVAARMLELRSPTAVSEIAAHYHAAGNDEQAYRYAVMAADRAASVFAHDEAITCLSIAQRHAPSPAELAGIRAQLAELGEAAGRYDYAEEMSDLALDWLGQHGAAAQAVPVRRLRESLRLRRGRAPLRAIDELQLLLSLAESAEDHAECAALWIALASAHLALADWPQAERMSRRALDLATAQDDIRWKGEASLQLGRSRAVHAPAEALVFLRDAESLFGSVGDVLGESFAAAATGTTLTRMGRLADANEATSHASDLARAAHSASASALAALGMADIAIRRGEFDLAAEWLNDAARLYAALRDEPGRATVSLTRAILSFEQDGIADARQIFRAVAARAVDLGIPWMELAAHAGGALCLPDGRPPELDARWGRVNELLAGAGPDWWFPGRERVDALAIRVALAAGHVSVATGLFEHAVELAEAHDAWACCWLVAQAGDALVAEGLPAARATVSVAARRAAEFAFAPLAQRLSLQLAAR